MNYVDKYLSQLIYKLNDKYINKRKEEAEGKPIDIEAESAIEYEEMVKEYQEKIRIYELITGVTLDLL